jgi:hypothetical protein
MIKILSNKRYKELLEKEHDLLWVQTSLLESMRWMGEFDEFLKPLWQALTGQESLAEGREKMRKWWAEHINEDGK